MTSTLTSTSLETVSEMKTPEKKSAGRKTGKEKFQKKYGLYEDKNHFLIAITTPLFDKYNADIWADILPGLSDMGFQIAIRANAQESYKAIAEAYTEDHTGTCTLISEDHYEEIYQAADVLLVFSDDDETKAEVKNALSHGVIPIIANDFPLENIENYNPNLENGNSFVYYKKSAWSLFAALVRAYENYRFPYDWKNICKAAGRSIKN
jgi:glycogen synthase